MSRAKTLSGVKGNLRFIVGYKTWAALLVFLAGAGIAAAVCVGSANAASPAGEFDLDRFDAALEESDREFWQLASSGGRSPKGNCHRDPKPEGWVKGDPRGRHYHVEGTNEIAGPCIKRDGETHKLKANALCADERISIMLDLEYDDWVRREYVHALVWCVQGLKAVE